MIIVEVIIVCHTEFGFVHNKNAIFDKNATIGVEEGTKNLIKVADKYGARVTFAVCPEVMKHFPKDVKHEIGLHVHPGWVERQRKGFKYYVGDAYLKEHCKQSINSAFLTDYPYEEQVEMIKTGKDYLADVFSIEPKVFVAGRWSENNDTIKALIEAGFTHDCSASPNQKSEHVDWTKLPRICTPYHPSEKDYQKKGNLPLLIVPISQYFPGNNVNPEVAPFVGVQWLKAVFLEYHRQSIPLFHICLHSPCMTDPYFITVMNELLKFISVHKNLTFKFTSEVKEYNEVNAKTDIIPYLFMINRNIIRSLFKKIRGSKS